MKFWELVFIYADAPVLLFIALAQIVAEKKAALFPHCLMEPVLLEL